MLITNGTLNFFGLEKYGMVFNQYFLSIMDHRLDIDPACIGKEAFFGDDGRAYAYWGVFPALLRAPFYPFIDLKSVPVSRIIVFVSAVLIAVVSQNILKDIMRKSEGQAWNERLILTANLLIWFASPVMLLSTNGSVYHEPIVLGLLGVMLFMWIVLRGILIHSEIAPRRMILLALIAGCVLHTRMTLALALYVGVSVFCLLHVVRLYRQYRSEHGPWSSLFKALLSPKNVLAPMLILFVFGALLLFTNWVKWGDPFNPAPLKHYGFLVEGEGWSGRHAAVRKLGRFNLRRVIPGLVFHLMGVGMGGRAYSVYYKLTDMFGTGVMRLEDPVPALLMWGPWFLSGFYVFRRMRRKLVGEAAGPSYLILALTVLIPALLILSYPTITVRYKSEFWPFLFLGFCVLFAAKGPVAADGANTRFIRNFSVWSVFSALVCVVVSIYYRTTWVSQASGSWVWEKVLDGIKSVI
ncbi:MAG: hypothetical protein AB7D39_00210 [Pseudodesulfovibrio sp.]|uniref:hypothetical protein n=1 Tax=Pseudodesulfovibrio sp. TaxID=2035812 RepID=UPI003D0A17C9